MSNTRKLPGGRKGRQLERIPLDQLTRSICAWRECDKTTTSVSELTPGWRCIVLASGSLLNRNNLINADRDGVLCPDHFIELDRLLKPLS